GTVTVRGKKVGRPAKRITLHQRNLNVTGANIVKHDKKGETNISIARINHHQKLEEVRLHSDSLLYPGDYTLSLDFMGTITDAMVGIYPCYFADPNKVDEKSQEPERKMLIATQFESHHARSAFPCIDEQ